MASRGGQARLRPRTLDTYRRLVELYVRKPIGGRRLGQITPLELQKLYNDMTDRGLSPRTVRHVHAILSSAFKQAVRWKQMATNPASYVDLPRQQRAEMRALTPQEAEQFLSVAADSPWGVLFSFALVSGMRPGEYLALQWKDVDLKASTVVVQRALVRRSGSWAFEEPKTSRSRRTVPIPPSIGRELADHRRRQIEYRLSKGSVYEDLDLVFAGESGQPLDEHNLARRHFKPLLKAAGLPEILRLYDLRHTCATLLLAAGENPKVVSERLGHASITLTLDTYSHVLPTMQAGAAEKLERLLFGR